MRSFTPKILRAATLVALLVTVPFAGAYAGPREAALINQIESVDTYTGRDAGQQDQAGRGA